MLTDPLSLGIAAAAGGLAVLIGWKFVPRPPELDGERWFKLAFATLLRGRVEADGGGAEDWERAVRRFVPYHPAGRAPELKVVNPIAALLPGAALPGEVELLDSLGSASDRAARWRLLYDDDVAANAARFADPASLGEAFDWSSWLALPRAPGENSWDAFARWGAGDASFRAALAARLGARFVVVHGRAREGVPSVAAAFQAELGAVDVPWAGDLAATVAATRAALSRIAEQGPDARAILIGEEAGTTAILHALVDEPELRDHVDAVASIGGVIGGDPAESGPLGEPACVDWLGANFTHLRLDTERVRWTPYFSIQWLDRAAEPPGAGGLPIASARFPPPRQDPGAIPLIESVDLGVLPADPAIPVDLIARALAAVVGCWVLSRR